MKQLYLLITVAISSQFFSSAAARRADDTLESTLSATKSGKSSASLAFVGDILFHDHVYEDGQIEEDTYSFFEMVEVTKPYISEVDLAVANSESTIGGVELGLYGTHKRFNSPIEVGEMIKDLGFDFVTMANNHILDYGQDGVFNALDNWEKIGLPTTGCFRTEKDRQKISIEVRNGISFAILSYTTFTNSKNSHNASRDDLTNLLQKRTFSQFKDAMKRAKKLADVVIVAIHAGDEYERYPTKRQMDLFEKIAECDPDIIIGHHPHVLEPITWLQNSKGKKIFAAYSLGNFFSGQVGLYRSIGGILRFEVEKEVNDDGESVISVVNPSFLLTYVYDEDLTNYKMHLLKDVEKLQDIYQEMRIHMNQWMPELEVN